jgi:hypothetical protein
MAMPTRTLTYIVKHSGEKTVVRALAKGVVLHDGIFGVIESVAGTTAGRSGCIDDQPHARQFHKQHMQFLYDGTCRAIPIEPSGRRVNGPVVAERLKHSERCTLRADEIGAIIEQLEHDAGANLAEFEQS